MRRTFVAFALLASLASPVLALASSDIPREKGPLIFIDRDGNRVGIPAIGSGPLHATTPTEDVATARMPGPSGKGPVINQHGRCLTLLSPFRIHWARCEPGDARQLWTRHDGGLQGSAPYAGQIDADTRLARGTLHIVRGEPGLRFADAGRFVPAND